MWLACTVSGAVNTNYIIIAASNLIVYSLFTNMYSLAGWAALASRRRAALTIVLLVEIKVKQPKQISSKEEEIIKINSPLSTSPSANDNNSKDIVIVVPIMPIASSNPSNNKGNDDNAFKSLSSGDDDSH